MLASAAFKAIDEYIEQLDILSKKIWETPELAYKEFFACKLCAEILEKEGFAVEVGYGGIPTAVRAEFGFGKPVIGFLGEYDALPGQSQKLVSEKDPVQAGAPGHGCGHNLIAAAHIGGAIGLKREIEEKGLTGTVVFYGCPAEEVLTGKGFMARAGAFKELSAAICFHPGNFTRASYSVLTGVNSIKYHFHGTTAHAACNPEQGRSALDAVELMNVGVNYLREHVPMDVRIHYCIIEGGTAPNIVPDNASVWYYDRALTPEVMQSVEERILNIAKGAALMTGTEVEVERLGGCYPALPNHVLADLVDECMREIPQIPWTEEELEFARKINETIPQTFEDTVKFSGSPEGTQIFSGVMPIDTADDYGSSDVGDVGHIVPTTFFKTACYNIAAPGHSWQVAACVGGSIGKKGMLYGAKILALAGAKILNNPAIADRAKEEFDRSMNGKVYKCLIPDNIEVPK